MLLVTPVRWCGDGRVAGAILHDHELTYSLCIPSANRWSSQNEELYFLMHDVLVELLAPAISAASQFV